MGRGDLLERMRRTASGWAQSDFETVLRQQGYELVREVRHGAMYRHPLLAAHPELEVRLRYAILVIPKGRSLKEYVAEEVIASIDVLLRYRQELGDAAEREKSDG
jgi:hypothetical protein